VKIFGRFLFPWISCFCHLLSCSVCAQISQEPNLSSIEPLKRLRFFSLLASRASLASYSVLRPTAASLGNLFLLAHFSARKFLATVPLLVVGSCLGFCFSRGSGFVFASACVSSRSQARVPLRAARISAHFPVSLSKGEPLSLPLVFVAGLNFSPADSPCTRIGFFDRVANTPSNSRFLAPVRSAVVACWPLPFCLCTARLSFGFGFQLRAV
jgi:hypothetical protein